MEIATKLAHTAFSLAMGRESELCPVSIKSVTRNLQAYENDTKLKSNIQWNLDITKKGHERLAKSVHYNEVSLHRGYLYLVYYYWGKKYRSFK